MWYFAQVYGQRILFTVEQLCNRTEGNHTYRSDFITFICDPEVPSGTEHCPDAFNIQVLNCKKLEEDWCRLK